MAGTNLGEREEEDERRGTPPRSGESSVTRHLSVDNRMESFLFVFEDTIPKDIWDRILGLSPVESQDLIAKSLSEGLLTLHDEREDKDRLAVYFRGAIPSHFGKIHGDKIRSKWGQGPAWNHGLWEIPHSYGDRVKYSTGDIDYSVLKKVIERLEARIRKSANNS